MGILGDPGAVSRAGRKGATKVFKHFCRAFSPGPTDRPWVSEDEKWVNCELGAQATQTNILCALLMILYGKKWET